MQNFSNGYSAIVFGASGGIGSAIAEYLKSDPRSATVISLSRNTDPAINFEDESTIAVAAERMRSLAPFQFMFDATGILHEDDLLPEKSLSSMSEGNFQRAFLVNTIGPALLLKHFTPLLDKASRSVFATLSARVGSIEDNRLGGWYAYRASKSALNMILKTASIEVQRRNKNAVLLALHPGTVHTPLSAPFVGGNKTVTAKTAAQNLMQVIDEAHETGAFLAYDGTKIEW